MQIDYDDYDFNMINKLKIIKQISVKLWYLHQQAQAKY